MRDGGEAAVGPGCAQLSPGPELSALPRLFPPRFAIHSLPAWCYFGKREKQAAPPGTMGGGGVCVIPVLMNLPLLAFPCFFTNALPEQSWASRAAKQWRGAALPSGITPHPHSLLFRPPRATSAQGQPAGDCCKPGGLARAAGASSSGLSNERYHL